eukprot:9533091-Lingulodinium_polyedra.AAC.1
MLAYCVAFCPQGFSSGQSVCAASMCKRAGGRDKRRSDQKARARRTLTEPATALERSQMMIACGS